MTGYIDRQFIYCHVFKKKSILEDQKYLFKIENIKDGHNPLVQVGMLEIYAEPETGFC